MTTEQAKSPPPLEIPDSEIFVKVRIIDTTVRLLGAPARTIWQPAIKGFDNFDAGTWAFLIEHPSGRKLLFDLGLRKDWWNTAPACGLQELVDSGVIKRIEVKKNISEILRDNGVRLEEVEGLIWSHFHWDHIGDPSTFPPTTKLIVGPGVESNFFPGFPTDPNSPILQSDYAGRELREIDFSSDSLQIAQFKAFDYFKDGSFYILDSPGHAIGHLSGLARTTPSPGATFIHMCGDTANHAGEVRPSVYQPLPEFMMPSPSPNTHPGLCPGHLFQPIMRNESPLEHILEFQNPPEHPKHDTKYAANYSELRATIQKIEELDGHSQILTVMAHDWSLKDVVDEFPEDANAWIEKAWKGKGMWRFLRDFAGIFAF
ncbi:hypothetical protein EV356DRAFT_253227 [Viridothelium virens]|uniref:Metallo-beta-lactamase domain-containing protein n=1 Tax=Viridothelium virens TaxID=1048519 RepID=A0A6A6H3F8_VIRVR|nr:hypothetical protein EV356DRAFT_253227 [Viridothelium virens]